MSDTRGANNDPSMDDILASIRKIISDDEARSTVGGPRQGSAALPPQRQPIPPRAEARAAVPPPMRGAQPAAQDDVLLLTDIMEEPRQAAPAARMQPQAPFPPAPTLRPAPAPARIDPARATEMPQPSVIHSPPPPPARPVASEQSFPTMQPRPPAPQGVSPIGSDQSLVGSNVIGAASSAFDRLNQAVQESVPPPAAANPGPAMGVGGKTIEDMVKEMLRPMLKDWLDRNLPPMVERIVEREIVRLTRR